MEEVGLVSIDLNFSICGPKDRSELKNSVSQSKLQTFHSPNFHLVIPTINRCYIYKLSTFLVNATLPVFASAAPLLSSSSFSHFLTPNFLDTNSMRQPCYYKQRFGVSELLGFYSISESGRFSVMEMCKHSCND